MEPLIVTMLEHRSGVARYPEFSRKAPNLDFYVTLPHKNAKAQHGLTVGKLKVSADQIQPGGCQFTAPILNGE